LCEKSCGNVAKATRVPRELHPDAERLACLDALGLKSLLLVVATTCSTSAGTCIKYTYDGAGNLKTRIDVTGTSTFTYDFENRVTAKNTPAGNSSVTYDATGNVTKYTDASGSVSYTCS
jgi:YD repeat-containing protein